MFNFLSLALLTAAGGGAGSVCRWLIGLASTRLWNDHLPWGTLIVNILGSFIIGLAVELITHKLESSPEVRALVVTGFLGGFTTFSSFSLDNMTLLTRGDSALAIAYMLGSVLVSLVFVFAGYHVARHLS